MSDERPDGMPIDPEQLSVETQPLDEALPDLVDAWGRSELGRGSQAMVSADLPEPMVRDLAAARSAHGIPMIVLACLLGVLFMVLLCISITSRLRTTKQEADIIVPQPSFQPLPTTGSPGD